MKLTNIATVISIARDPEQRERNLSLHRGFDETGAVRYIITSTLNNPEYETIGFFFSIDNAIECLVANHKLDNLKSFLLENPDPGANPDAVLGFLRFIEKVREDIAHGVKNHIYDDILPTNNTDEIVNPEKDNEKSLGLTRELNKLVDQFVDNIRESIS